MAKKKAVSAQAAIDQAQDALDVAEKALQADAAKAAGIEAKAVADALEADEAKTATDAKVADAAPEKAAQKQSKPSGTIEYFTLAQALVAIGRDSFYSSSHAIHRTMIAVSFDGGFPSIGMYVEAEAQDFDRETAKEGALVSLGIFNPSNA